MANILNKWTHEASLAVIGKMTSSTVSKGWRARSMGRKFMIFFANKFLFSLEYTCYNKLMHFTILYHPELMVRR